MLRRLWSDESRNALTRGVSHVFACRLVQFSIEGIVMWNLTYKNIPCSEMSPEEIKGCAQLFSENYGMWSQSAGATLRGRPIRLSPGKLRKLFVEKPNRYVAMMFLGDHLIGHVFYIRCESPWNASRKMTFVQQLVLDRQYRGNRLGLKMLQAVFGLSNDDAWGLYTSNPYTVRALEDATFRHVSVEKIKENLQKLRPVLRDIFENETWLNSFREGCVDTNFRVSHDKNSDKIKKAYKDRPFPITEPLREGEEYLAITFSSQPVDVEAAALRLFSETSWEILNDAYSKMNMASQKWAAFAKEEVEQLFSRGCVKSGDIVLDLGCGIGRHAIELAKKGCVVHGIDFSKRLIDEAKEAAKGLNNLTFEVADILSLNIKGLYDVVLCVYDVIGSSIQPGVDDSIASSIRRALKNGGIAIVSVMNLEMTRKYCRRGDNTFSNMQNKEDFMKLIKLPPSPTMQNTGEIFKGQLLLLNPNTGVVYRKEQFENQNDMPREYVIADRRYTANGLCKLFRFFKLEDIRYVRAGHWDERLPPDARHAKEVLGVFRKRSFFKMVCRALFHFLFSSRNRKPSFLVEMW